MEKNQLSKEIDKRFETEENKVVDNTEEDSKKEKFFRVILTCIMSAVVIGSLAYSLITAILQ
ncbi:hypothetical protein [Enterococcus alishanensis]|uniref:DUF4044 domain-containing protein n=1 Tax=Enterococcus alishanensis TaxID=1303817 RepID=A0ABS6TE22_9ENTE|nr:hypothetical protein [Enterococcus alishanensis]MBV7391110.1 hypothetical protein [Enterococcus alishanensis]